MISKELLSEILVLKYVDDIQLNWKNVSEIAYAVREQSDSLEGKMKDIMYNNRFKTINIYELAHKCKEWAFTEGYQINSYRMMGRVESTYSCNVHTFDKRWFDAEGIESTEPEAIFKACQWVLENK